MTVALVETWKAGTEIRQEQQLPELLLNKIKQYMYFVRYINNCTLVIQVQPFKVDQHWVGSGTIEIK